jgi:hypothetical protein
VGVIMLNKCVERGMVRRRDTVSVVMMCVKTTLSVGVAMSNYLWV